MKESFEELVDLIGERNSLWVELTTGVNICLVAVSDYKNKVFTGRYVPCVPNAKTFPVKYDKIESTSGGN